MKDHAEKYCPRTRGHEKHGPGEDSYGKYGPGADGKQYGPGKARPMNDGYERDSPGTHGSEKDGPGNYGYSKYGPGTDCRGKYRPRKDGYEKNGQMRDGLMKDDGKTMVVERMVMKRGIPKRTARILQIGFLSMGPEIIGRSWISWRKRPTPFQQLAFPITTPRAMMSSNPE